MSAPVSDLVARDHERIWLQNKEDAKHQCEGRVWCQDKVWPNEPEEGEPTEYVRADLYAALAARITELEAALARIVEDRFATRMDMVLIAHDALVRARASEEKSNA